MRRNEANVSWNPLMIQVDSASVMFSELTRAGIAGKSAAALYASRACERQNTTRSTYRRAGEYFCGMRPSARVSVGDSATEAGGGAGVLPSMFHLCAEAEDKLSSVYKMGLWKEDGA